MANEKTTKIQDQPQSKTSPPEQKHGQTTKETATKKDTQNNTESERLAKQRRRASTYSDPNFAGAEEVHRMIERLAESRAQQVKEQEDQKKTKAGE